MENLEELQKKADALIESVNPKDHVLGLEILRNSFELTDEHIIEHLIIKPFKEFIEMLKEFTLDKHVSNATKVNSYYFKGELTSYTCEYNLELPFGIKIEVDYTHDFEEELEKQIDIQIRFQRVFVDSLEINHRSRTTLLQYIKDLFTQVRYNTQMMFNKFDRGEF
jgi:hypothetical protein